MPPVFYGGIFYISISNENIPPAGGFAPKVVKNLPAAIGLPLI
jgi:hypothetical protein